MFYVLAILGVLWLAFSVAACRSTLAITTSLPASSRWRAGRNYLWLPGLSLGIASLFIGIRYAARVPYIAYGLPFQVFAIDVTGRDYVGIISLPYLLMDLFCWVGLAHAAYWLAFRLKFKANLTSGA